MKLVQNYDKAQSGEMEITHDQAAFLLEVCYRKEAVGSLIDEIQKGASIELAGLNLLVEKSDAETN